MRIVYLIEDICNKGGAERIISEKANLLVERMNYDVTIVSIYEDERKPSYPLAKEIDVVFLRVPFANKKGNVFLSRAMVLLKAISRLNATLKEIKPDIIFFATTLSGLLLPLCKTKAKRVYESHSAKAFTPYNKFFGLMERRADQIVCLTNDDAKEYRHAKKVKVIPNFTNEPISFVSNYGVKRAVAVGRLEHVKGFDILINCWKRIAKKHPDWQLHIYGEGSLQQKLQKQIEDLQLGDKVKLCGRNEGMMETYCDYSLFLMTSRNEGLPMVLIESQSVGLPAVTFNFKFGASDVVISGSNGILIEQGNEAAFVEAMDMMMSSEQLREQYGINAKETFAKFSRGKIFQQWLELISELKG